MRGDTAQDAYREMLRGYDFGARLREMRLKVPMTQTALAELLSVSHALVSAWECGTRPPLLEDVVRIAIYTGASPEYVFARKGRE